METTGRDGPIRLEREALYREVWAEPVTKVARRYGISDVGLQKICRRLEVPLPPRGYWARVAAGRTPRKAPLLLTKGPTVHLLQKRPTPRDLELATRVAAMVVEHVQYAESAPLHDSIDACLPVVRRMAEKLAKTRHRTDRGWLAVGGTGSFSMEVSEASTHQALLVLDALLRTFQMAGARLKGPVGPGYPAHFVWDDEPFTVRIRERGRQPAEMDPETAARLSTMGAERRAAAAASQPTGALSLTVVPLSASAKAVTWRDKVGAPIQARLGEIAHGVKVLAQRLRVEREVAAERRRREEEEARVREQKREIRRAHLRRLEGIYEEALRWQRAQLLRGYLAALIAQHPDPTPEVASELSWLQNAVDWLDPATEQHWPEVDDVEDYYLAYRPKHPLWEDGR